MKSRLRPRSDDETVLLAKLHVIDVSRAYFARLLQATQEAAIVADGEDLIREHGALRLLHGLIEQMEVANRKLEQRRSNPNAG